MNKIFLGIALLVALGLYAYDSEFISLNSIETTDGVEVIEVLDPQPSKRLDEPAGATFSVDQESGEVTEINPRLELEQSGRPGVANPVREEGFEVDVVELNFSSFSSSADTTDPVREVEPLAESPRPEESKPIVADLSEEVYTNDADREAPPGGSSSLVVEVVRVGLAENESPESPEAVQLDPEPSARESAPVEAIEALGIEDSDVFVIDASATLSPRTMDLDKLTALPAQEITMYNKPLHEVVTYLAQISGANYIAPPPSERMNRLITLQVRSNPWNLLQRIARDYQVGMDYEDGIWQFYPVQIGELIMRRYQLLYNNLDAYEITAPELSTSIVGGGNTSGNSGEGGTIEVKTDELIKGVQQIMGMPLTGIEGAIEEGYTLSEPTAASALNDVPDSPQGMVYYAKDSNELLVAATRQQHDYIEEFLAIVDKPQRMVWMEIMLVEMTYDPFTNFGLDFTGVSGNGITVSGLEYQPFLPGGPQMFLDGFTLSSNDWTVVSNFLSTDTEAKVLQHPRITTLNKQPVSFQVVTQEPVVSSSGIISTGATATNEIEVSYLDIGLIMTISPVIYADGPAGSDSPNVQLNIGLVLSNVLGTKIIREIEYPVVAKRQWEQRAIVPTGVTLAMGGVIEERNEERLTKVPILGDIPLVGGLFSDREVVGSERHLMAFITPVILEPKDIQDRGNVEKLPRQKEFVDLELHRVKAEDPLYPLVDFTRANTK